MLCRCGGPLAHALLCTRQPLEAWACSCFLFLFLFLLLLLLLLLHHTLVLAPCC